MDGQAACDKWAARYELERRGITLRLCDTCYWGEVEADTRPAATDMENQRADPQATRGR